MSIFAVDHTVPVERVVGESGSVMANCLAQRVLATDTTATMNQLKKAHRSLKFRRGIKVPPLARRNLALEDCKMHLLIKSYLPVPFLLMRYGAALRRSKFAPGK